MKIRVEIGDNSNKNYHGTAEAEINEVDYVVYKDNMNWCTSYQYDNSWDNICERISRQNNLPYDWFVDSELEPIN